MYILLRGQRGRYEAAPRTCLQTGCRCYAVQTKQRAVQEKVSDNSSYYGKDNHLAHSFPIIESPVDNLIISDLDSSDVFGAKTSVDIGPDEDRRSCAVAYTIGCVAPASLLKYTITFFTPLSQGSEGKFNECGTDVQVKTFSRRYRGLDASCWIVLPGL